MLNHIVIMGRLTRDPELRRTQAGVPVASFRLAVDRDFVNQSGERQADFIDVVVWRNTAEFVSKYFSKGRMAVVSGRLQMRDWNDKEGNRRTSAEVVAENVYFGDSRRDSDGQGGGSYSRQYSDAPAGGSYGAQGGGSYGAQGGGSYGGQGSGGYGAQGGSYGGQGGVYSAPADSDFADLSDDDGDLPF